MNQIEALLQSDDRHFGSFGSLEKGIGYATLFCFTLPILLVPFLYTAFRKNIYKVTALLVGFLVFLFLVLRFRFSWIVRLDHHLQRLYHA